MGRMLGPTYQRGMRSSGVARLVIVFVFLVAFACGNDRASQQIDAGFDPTATRTLPFGPFTIAAQEEINNQCVQITLANPVAIYVSSVELTTGAGFHHSNWFFVPEQGAFDGPDGTYKCSDRNFNEPVAAIKGGVLFAQSTQAPHEVQAFPPGVVIKIPARSKIVAAIHLLNPADSAVTLTPTITLVPIAEAAVTTQLHGISLENHALGLPPQQRSRFVVDCDLTSQWQTLYNLGQVTSPTPDFKIYYALAHYHRMGTGLTIEAARPDSSSVTVYSTTTRIGDSLGAQIVPAFAMASFSRLRLSCDYFNNTNAPVVWGVGTNEMCVFLAFSDSDYNWGGGIVTDEPAGTGVDVGGVMTFTAPSPCTVFANDARR